MNGYAYVGDDNNMNSKIIFISYIQDPYTAGTSTQIMTLNLLQGLGKIGMHITFVAIVDDEKSSGNIIKCYSVYADNIIIIKSRIGDVKHYKYIQLWMNFRGLTQSSLYKKDVEKISVEDDDIIISHSPTLEAIPIADELKKKNKKVRYIQYWSDPYALSGITPEAFNLKRIPFYFLEKYALSKSSEIVYGTKTLCDIQKKLYNTQAQKMRYIDVSYCENELIEKQASSNNLFGYSGNYFSDIRNIMPLYNAFKDMTDEKLLIIGSGDVCIQNTGNIQILKRVPQTEIVKYENKMDILICILNTNCIQIPGKIFYNTNSNKPILVILDGPYKNEIKEYLISFNRFEFCENEKNSIKAAVKKILSNEEHINFRGIDRLSPQCIAKQLLAI